MADDPITVTLLALELEQAVVKIVIKKKAIKRKDIFLELSLRMATPYEISYKQLVFYHIQYSYRLLSLIKIEIGYPISIFTFHHWLAFHIHKIFHQGDKHHVILPL